MYCPEFPEEEQRGHCTLIKERPPVQPTVGKYNSTLCQGLITDYFVIPTVHPFQPPGLAEEVMEGMAWNISLEGLLDPISPIILPSACQEEWKKFACGAVFMEYEKSEVFGSSVNLGLVNATILNVNLPKFLRRQQCTKMTHTCKAFIDFAAKQLGKEMDVCGALVNQPGSPFNGIAQFPDSDMHQLVAIGGLDQPLCAQINLPYAGMTIDLAVEVYTKTRILDYEPYASFRKELACPFPLKIPPPHKADRGLLFTGCALPCPLPYWPKEVHEGVKWYLVVVTVVSFVAISYTVATFTFFKRLRKQRQTLIFSICTWFCTFSQMCMIFKQHKFHHLCSDDNIDRLQQRDGFSVCLMQSFTLMYFASACAYWWLLVSIELFLKVHNKLKYRLSFRASFIIAQTAPFGWIAYFYYWKAMGNQGLHLCFVAKEGYTDDRTEQNPTGVVLGVDVPWYAVTAFCLNFGTVLMLFTIRKIVSTNAKTQKKHSGVTLILTPNPNPNLNPNPNPNLNLNRNHPLP